MEADPRSLDTHSHANEADTKMPCQTKYQVESRYTNRKALAEKLQKIFPSTKVADLDIKVSRKW